MPGGFQWDDFENAVAPAVPTAPKAEPLKSPELELNAPSSGPDESGHFTIPGNVGQLPPLPQEGTPGPAPASQPTGFDWDAHPNASPTPDEPVKFDESLARGWSKLSDVVDTVNKNIQVYNSDKGGKDENGNPIPKPAESWMEAIEAGWQGSFPGLTGRGKLPDLTAENLPGIKGWMLGMASHMTTMISEIPEMALAAGGAGAAVAPAAAAAGPYAPLVVGATGAYAAFAVPSLLRRTYWDHLAKGNVKDFQDFWERTSAGILEAHNEGLKGVGMYAAGAGAASALEPIGAQLIQKGWSTAAVSSMTKTGVLMSEIGGLSAVGSSIDHKMPSPSSIAEALISMGAFHAAHYLSGPAKALGENFARTGMSVADQAAEANKNPALKTQYLSENPDAKLIAEMSTGIKQPDEPPKEPPAEKEPKESVPEKHDVDAALARVAGTIGTKEPKPAQGTDKYTWYQRLFSQFDPIKRMQEWLDPDSKIPENERPFTVSTLSKAVKGKMAQFLNVGTLDFKTNEYNGKGLFQILQPLEDVGETGKLSLYMKARRAYLDLEPRGVKTGMADGDPKLIYENLKDRFEPYAKEVTAWSNRVTQYAIDAELLPQNWFEKVAPLNEHYIKYSAIFEDADGKPTGQTSTPGSFKAIKGGEYATEDPLLAISQNMMAIVKAAEANKSKLSAVNLVEKDPNQKIFETISQAKPVDIKAAELRDIVDEQFGVDVGDEAKDARIWRTKGQTALLPNQFEVKRNGVRNVIEVNDTPIGNNEVIKGEDFANALNSLNGDTLQQNFLVKAMQGITKSVKFGSTFTGEFLTFHLLNNKILSAVQSQYGPPTTRALFDTMHSIFHQDERFWTFLKDGGGGTYFDLNENYLAQNMSHLEKETGGSPWNKMYNLIPNTVHAIENVGSMLEQSYRMVEYEKSKASALSKGQSPQAAGAKGAMDARSLTVDYDRRGLVTSGYNSIAAFTNMKLQHMDRVYQGLRDPKTSSQMIMQGLKWITFPTLALKLGQMNNPRVQQANQLEKDLNWIIDVPWFTKAQNNEEKFLPDEQKELRSDGWYVNRGVTFKLRAKGALATLFKVIPERLVDGMMDFAGHKQPGDPEILKGLMSAVGEILPGFPDAPKPLAEQGLNKNFWTGHSVVTDASERVLPAEQYTNYTSATAKALGKLLSSVPPLKSVLGGPSLADIGPKEAKIASPEVIDNYIQDYTGGLGKYVTFALDQALYKAGVVPDTRPAMKLNDIPFIKAFVLRYPEANSASIEEFRAKEEESEKMMATVKLDLRRFQPGEAEALAEKNQDLMASMKGIHSFLSQKQQQIQKIYDMPLYDPVKQPNGMTRQDKGQLIDGLYYAMIEAAKQGVMALDQGRKTILENKGVSRSSVEQPPLTIKGNIR